MFIIITFYFETFFKCCLIDVITLNQQVKIVKKQQHTIWEQFHLINKTARLLKLKFMVQYGDNLSQFMTLIKLKYIPHTKLLLLN